MDRNLIQRKTSGISFIRQEDENYLYQTLSSDILVNGSFNVNSTSVDAWASQLTAMKEDIIENRIVSDNIDLDVDETPVFVSPIIAIVNRRPLPLFPLRIHGIH